MPTNQDFMEHPESALVLRAIDEGLTNLPVTTSPLAIALGTRLLFAADGKATLSFTVGDPFIQGNGVIQGGIISAMLDFAMIFAAFSRIPPKSSLTTVSQTSNFFRPVLPGRVIAKAEIEKSGRTLIYAHAVLCNEEEVLLANATAPMAVISLSSLC